MFAGKASGLIHKHSTRLGTNNLACYDNDTKTILVTIFYLELLMTILITLNTGDITNN